MKFLKRFHYNSPVMLTFALISLAVLIAGEISGGWTTAKLFSVYRSPLTDLLTYPRLILHVLGHNGYQHYIGNMLLLLVIGPALEEKYGSKHMIYAMLLTAFISGLVQWLLFPATALCGASGLVFMMIVLLSLSGMKNDTIPATLIFVIVFYLGKEIIDGLFSKDSISQLTHLIGGGCGAFIGLVLFKGKRL
jgi:rhomboid protease GluP